MRYSHCISISFVVDSDNPTSPTVGEVREVMTDLQQVWDGFEDDEVADEVLAIEIFDTEENG